MKICLILLLSIFYIFSLKAQTPDSLEKIADKIVAEATKMYKSEMASWYATDLLMGKYKDKTTQLGGYASYAENGKDKCIFYSKGENPKVILTVSFKGVYAVEKAETNTDERPFTPLEKEYFNIRQAAAFAVSSDTFFKAYKNTNFNLIPIIEGDSRKVYILTGPQDNGLVLFGNDYELIFDKNNVLTSKIKLHNSLVTLDYTGEKTQVGAMHTHVPTKDEFITATDVCTLMLYGKTAKWQTHFVMSEKYVSTWLSDGNKVTIVDKNSWEMSIDGKGRKKKK